MAGATVGRLLPGSSFSILGIPAMALAPVYGRGAYAAMGPGVRVSYGQYKIEGTTKQITTFAPLYRAVLLLTIDGKYMMRGAMSLTADGSFAFTNLPAGEYTVIGLAQNNVQNGVVAATVTAVAM